LWKQKTLEIVLFATLLFVVFGAAPPEQLVAAQTSASRFAAWVLGVFAAAALVLSVIGICGVRS
jgi:hypothetical protein